MAFFSLDPEHRGGRARARLLLFGAGVLFGLSAILAKLAARGGMDGGQVTLCRFTVGLGLVGVAERAEMLGGRLDAGPLPGRGFRVEATFPLRKVDR